jgi:protoporphyrin/coproporphyrin ferrochelatase
MALSSSPQQVLLLMNLGSPDSTSVKDVRKYLREFLMDERVIDIPAPIRSLLVKGIVVPFRAPKSAAAYKTIWTKEGSPLVYLTQQVKEKLEADHSLVVEICMRYGNPTPQVVLATIAQKYPSAKKVVLFPLYPHYAMSSYETAAVYVQQIHAKGNYPFTLTTVPPFYNHPSYISSLAESIQPYLHQPYDLLLFSYHGIPERHVKKSDPTGSHCLQQNNCCQVTSDAHPFCYRHQIITTTQLTAKQLGVDTNKFSFSFQSRLGRDAWLKPYTAQRLKELPAEGIKKILVVCPAFVSDCLETLEEMAYEGKEIFLEAGGESFTLIPCMNTQPKWISTIKELMNE